MLADGFINDNGISGVALAFFTVLVGGVSTTIIGVFQSRAKAVEARDAAELAKQEAQKAGENTRGVSNGFSGRVGEKLDRIIAKQEDLEKAFREHLEWHVDNPRRWRN